MKTQNITSFPKHGLFRRVPLVYTYMFCFNQTISQTVLHLTIKTDQKAYPLWSSSSHRSYEYIWCLYIHIAVFHESDIGWRNRASRSFLAKALVKYRKGKHSFYMELIR